MSQQETIQVQEVSVEGGFENKTTGATYSRLQVTDDQGRVLGKAVSNDYNSPVQEGDTATVVFDTGKTKAGAVYYKLQSITKGSSGTSKSSSSKTTTSKPSSTTKSSASTIVTAQVSKTPYQDTSKGQRNGMITGRAVELAVARNELTTDGLKQAALDVKDLADFVEKM